MNVAKTVSFFLLPLLILSLSGCDPVIAIPSAASEDAPMQVDADAEYLLRAGDTIKLTVFGEDSLTGAYVVGPSGSITVPLIKGVKASGLTKEALREKVASMLVSGGFLTKPLVTVDVVTVRPYYILGEVKNPGNYPWQPSMDAFKAIASAGGYTPRAAKNMLLIDRGEETGKKRLNAIEQTPILPGDSITVREQIF